MINKEDPLIKKVIENDALHETKGDKLLIFIDRLYGQISDDEFNRLIHSDLWSDDMELVLSSDYECVETKKS